MDGTPPLLSFQIRTPACVLWRTVHRWLTCVEDAPLAGQLRLGDQSTKKDANGRASLLKDVPNTISKSKESHSVEKEADSQSKMIECKNRNAAVEAAHGVKTQEDEKTEDSATSKNPFSTMLNQAN